MVKTPKSLSVFPFLPVMIIKAMWSYAPSSQWNTLTLHCLFTQHWAVVCGKNINIILFLFSLGCDTSPVSNVVLHVSLSRQNKTTWTEIFHISLRIILLRMQPAWRCVDLLKKKSKDCWHRKPLLCQLTHNSRLLRLDCCVLKWQSKNTVLIWISSFFFFFWQAQKKSSLH